MDNRLSGKRSFLDDPFQVRTFNAARYKRLFNLRYKFNF